MERKKKKFHSLLHSADLLERHLEIQLSPLGVRPKQARILNVLGRMEGASQIQLAREYDVSEASMSTMISRLISAGYIVREVDPTNRSCYILTLSDEGGQLIDKIHRAWAEIDELVERIIGSEDSATLSRITSQLRDGLGGRVAGLKKGRRSSSKRTSGKVDVNER